MAAGLLLVAAALGDGLFDGLLVGGRGRLGGDLDAVAAAEPIEKLTIYAPSATTSKINSAVSSRRGQILGFDAREGWSGWDAIEVYLPHHERQDFILELRSLTQGLGSFETAFDHMVELTGRKAEEVSQKSRAA